VIPLQIADNTREILRQEGAIFEQFRRVIGTIEEVSEEDEDDYPLEEKASEEATSPSDAVVGTSFDEKSDRLHGHQMDVVDIHPDEQPPDNEDGQGSL
jgi:hypothetical protein